MLNGIKLVSACNRPDVPLMSQPQLVYVLTELTPAASMLEQRLPLNFTLVLDHSGSMAGEKLRMVKEAVKNIIDQLDPIDVISIVAFESRTHLLVEAQLAKDKPDLKRQVDKIKNGGGTNMAPGLREGLKQVRHWQDREQISRIILLTDGEATDNKDLSRKVADQAGELDIPIIALGFGREWNEDFLIDLADRSMMAEPGSRIGKAEYIPKPADANRIFQEVYQSMQVVAREVALTIRMAQGLEARRVWKVVPEIMDIGRQTIQGRAILIPIGELEMGGAAYLVEIMLPPRPAGRVRIAQTDVTYTLSGAGYQRQAVDLIVNFTPDPTAYNQWNGHVMNIVERVQAFKLQTQALDEAEMGNVRGATQKLRQAVTILLGQGETELADKMQQEADRLEHSGEISSEGKKTIKLTSRKTVRLSE